MAESDAEGTLKCTKTDTNNLSGEINMLLQTMTANLELYFELNFIIPHGGLHPKESKVYQVQGSD